MSNPLAPILGMLAVCEGGRVGIVTEVTYRLNGGAHYKGRTREGLEWFSNKPTFLVPMDSKAILQSADGASFGGMGGLR